MSFHYERQQLAEELVLWTFYEVPSQEEWRDCLEEATAWLLDLERRGCRVGVVVDPTAMLDLSGGARRLTGEWRANQLPLIANTCCAAAYVADKPFWRSVMSAIFWFAEPVIPVQICASRRTAVGWVQDELARR